MKSTTQSLLLRKRLQLFEFLDLPWVTGWVRQGILEYLNFLLYRITQPYRGVEKILETWAREASRDTVLDMGSGGGGQIDWLLKVAAKRNVSLPRFVLSDMFPYANIPTYQRLQEKYGEGKIGFREHPVDACQPHETAIRLRSMFSIFHHLKETEARQMLADAVQHSDGILIAEGVRRAALPAAIMIALLPVYMFVMPFAAPHFTIRRLVFSALIPIIPLMMAFDGAISMLRAYTADEIVALFPPDAASDFEIKAHTLEVLGGIFSTTVVTARRLSKVKLPIRKEVTL